MFLLTIPSIISIYTGTWCAVISSPYRPSHHLPIHHPMISVSTMPSSPYPPSHDLRIHHLIISYQSSHHLCIDHPIVSVWIMKFMTLTSSYHLSLLYFLLHALAFWMTLQKTALVTLLLCPGSAISSTSISPSTVTVRIDLSIFSGRQPRHRHQQESPVSRRLSAKALSTPHRTAAAVAKICCVGERESSSLMYSLDLFFSCFC